MHDLQRIASPKNLINRIVYLNTPGAALPPPAPLRYGATQEGRWLGLQELRIRWGR